MHGVCSSEQIDDQFLCQNERAIISPDGRHPILQCLCDLWRQLLFFCTFMLVLMHHAPKHSDVFLNAFWHRLPSHHDQSPSNRKASNGLSVIHTPIETVVDLYPDPPKQTAKRVPVFNGVWASCHHRLYYHNGEARRAARTP